MVKSAGTGKRERDVSAIMRRVRGRDTAPEVLLRKALWSRGLRYRISPATLPGKPDIVIPAARLAIFVDGDFWHGGQWRKRRLTALEDQFTATRSRGYWLAKIRRNMQRDARTAAELLRQGWGVLRLWETDILADVEGCAQMIVDAATNPLADRAASALPQKTVAECFAGIGLMRMGLERQGWSVAFANDIDENKYKMYKGHFTDADQHVHVGDIHKLSPNEVPAVSLATASFPCNDLSLAGARNGLRGEQSSAFWGFVHLLAGMADRRPPLVLLENVTGFLTSHKGEDFRQVLLALNELGYSVDAFMLDAAHFVPQSRQRLFVIGVLTSSLAPGLESRLTSSEAAKPADARRQALPSSYESDVRPKALAKFILAHSEIHWNVRPLPAQPESSIRLEMILEDLPESAPEWWSAQRAEYLLEQMSPRHRELAERMIAGPDWSYGTVFRRMRNGKSMAELRADGIAGCLRTPRGGSGRQIIFKAGNGRYFARLLTPREAARLMGAEEYSISVPLNQALFGFGDAVCVPVIEWIAQHYLNPVVNELIHGRPLCASATKR